MAEVSTKPTLPNDLLAHRFLPAFHSETTGDGDGERAPSAARQSDARGSMRQGGGMRGMPASPAGVHAQPKRSSATTN
jgi:hypothetical protein